MLCAAAAACAAPAPNLVLLNARVFTADPARPWAEALAIRGDRIVAVGSSAEVGAQAGSGTMARDLGGRMVLPGFNNAHVEDAGLAAADLRAFWQRAVALGITSMQLFAGGRPVREAGAALVAADLPGRVRVFRMPRPGVDGESLDSRPHLPPQPSLRVDIRGMAFRFSSDDHHRLRQAVGWAYGTEDLLVVEPADDETLTRYVEAVESVGLPDVWRRKRPRIERPGPAVTSLAPRIRAQGMVVVQRPAGTPPLGSLVQQGVPLALAHGSLSPFETLAWATAAELGGEALTMEQAVTAMTRAAAYAELADRDKGHLSVGALADLLVASIDPFTAAADELARGRSVLTIIGGRTVHDVP